ncbi:MAG: RsmE family RNA methyltransferase [Planctomycetota bacterium]
MAKRYFHPELPERGRLELSPETARHLAGAMRIRPGSELWLFDGQGTEARVLVHSVRRSQVAVEVKERRSLEPPARRRVELAWSPPRGSRARQVLEHGTELGLCAFHPILVARTSTRLPRSTSRWQRVIRAASGQCGAAFMPRLEAPRRFGDFVAQILEGFEGERWLACPSGPKRPASRRSPLELPPALVLVGPEGGFTAAETRILARAGCRTLGLGPQILRTETAALAASALLLLGPPEYPREGG